MQLFTVVAIVFALTLPSSARTQKDGATSTSARGVEAELQSINKQRLLAAKLFMEGKVRQAIDVVNESLANTDSIPARIRLHDDLWDLCEAAYDLECLSKTLEDTEYFSDVQRLAGAGIDLRTMQPIAYRRYVYTVLYASYLKDDEALDEAADFAKNTVQRGDDVFSNPGSLGALHLILHEHFLRKRDLRAAEHARSAAIANLLLMSEERDGAYAVSKLIVGIVRALTRSQNLNAAIQLASRVDQYVSTSVPHTSPLYAEYRLVVGQLLAARGSDPDEASRVLLEAAKLTDFIEINEAVKSHRVGAARTLASFALVLSDPQSALAVHAEHPLSERKAEILDRESFAGTGEFLFAVSDVYLRLAAGERFDEWRDLFSERPVWHVSESDQRELDNYFNFTKGIITRDNELIIESTEERITIFEQDMLSDFEGVFLPDTLDKIVITTGLTAAALDGSRHSIDILLRGSEVVRRSARNWLADVSVMINAQDDEKKRNTLRSYVHLVHEKREWELNKIVEMTKSSSTPIGRTISEYSTTVSLLERIKDEVKTQKIKVPALPTVEEIQNKMSKDDVFITYVTTFGGVAKICINRDRAHIATMQFGEDQPNSIRLHTRLLALALESAHAPNIDLDSQYPVQSALFLKDALFGGLETCIAGRTRIAMAPYSELAGIPVGALLREAPPAREDGGFDLSKARWLIKDWSFSSSISARDYLASLLRGEPESASLPFLGVGDPVLDQPAQTKLASAALFRAGIQTRDGSVGFAELPDTAEELRTVGALFQAQDNDILLRDEATEELFRRKPLGAYDVIHFATHGLIAEEIPGLTQSALMFTPNSSTDPYDNGLLTASEISRLTLNARLIALSACNTAQYDRSQASRSVEDLQAAFTTAGTPTILASLWPVESRTARDLVSGFFAQWRSGEPAADALAVSIRQFLASADTAYQHPRFWAPFIVQGNGRVRGGIVPSGGQRPSFLEPLEGYEAGGEVLSADVLDGDMIVSMIDVGAGPKAKSVIARLNADRNYEWKIVSPEIGVGSVTVHNDTVYALGYTLERYPVPILRRISSDGNVERTIFLEDFRDHHVFDVAFVAGNVVLLLIPNSAAQTPSLVVLARDGRVLAQRQFETKVSGLTVSGLGSFLAQDEVRILVGLYQGRDVPSFDHTKPNVFGFPRSCFKNVSSRLIEVDKTTLNTVEEIDLPKFRITALESDGGDFFIGGESTDGCAMRGAASVLSLSAVKRKGSKSEDGLPFLWKDDDPFIGTIVGIGTHQEGIVVATRHQRALSAAMSSNAAMQAYTKSVARPDLSEEERQRLLAEATAYTKRWGDRPEEARESSLVRISPEGTVSSRSHFSAGLAAYAHGLAMIKGRPIAYGALGGVPAISRH